MWFSAWRGTVLTSFVELPSTLKNVRRTSFLLHPLQFYATLQTMKPDLDFLHAVVGMIFVALAGAFFVWIVATLIALP